MSDCFFDLTKISVMHTMMYVPSSRPFCAALWNVLTGLPGVEERISVGFLKLDEHLMDKLPRYAQAYDVVVIGDGDMSYVNEILHEVAG